MHLVIFAAKIFLNFVTPCHSLMFREFVSGLFRLHVKIRSFAVDAFDQTHYRFRHNAVPRPALPMEQPVFYSEEMAREGAYALT